MAATGRPSCFCGLQAYTQTITVSNPSRATVEATLRAGSSDRYTLSLTKLVLRPQQSVDVDVRLRVLKYAQIQKGVQLGQRDIFHIKARLTSRMCHCALYLLYSMSDMHILSMLHSTLAQCYMELNCRDPLTCEFGPLSTL